MKNKLNFLAVVSDVDFEVLLLTEKERIIGGKASVIRSILPYLQAEQIYLFGITRTKEQLGKEMKISDKIIFVPVLFIPKNSKMPSRFLVFWKSRIINKYLNQYSIEAIYAHSMEMSYWIDKKFAIVQHMHGATNAISNATFKSLRLPVFIVLWDKIRRRSLIRAKKIIAIDSDCFEIAKTYKSDKDILLIPNFVDTTFFYPDTAKSNLVEKFEQRRIALFVGRIEEVKGLDLFIDIIEKLAFKDSKWLGVIVGKGSSEKRLREYVKSKNLDKNIHFTGAIYSQIELRKLYTHSEILLLTSHHEGIPMTILESLACNTPVVSTNVGGIKSLKIDNLPCYTLNGRDPLKFTEKILAITSSNYSSDASGFPFGASLASKKINKAFCISKEKKLIFCPLSLPPPFYGSNISSQNIIENEKILEEFDLDVFSISYNESSQNVGKFELKKIGLILKNLFNLTLKSFNDYDLVYYVPAIKGIAFYRDLLLLLPFKLRQNKILIHVRGTGINERSNRSCIHKYFYKYFFKNTEVICLSELLVDDILNVHKGKIHIVNNAIKPIIYPPRINKNKVPVVLFLSNFIETKGIFVLLEAASKLKAKNINFSLNLIGMPRGNILPKIEEYITKFNLRENIVSIGPAYGEEKRKAFQKADLFVFPTYIEAWGRVINEAMNASLPVIATEVGSIPIIVDEGETGYVIKPKDSKELAEKMEILLLDRNLREKMGRKGRDKFYKKYTINILEKNMINVFNQSIK